MNKTVSLVWTINEFSSTSVPGTTVALVSYDRFNVTAAACKIYRCRSHSD